MNAAAAVDGIKVEQGNLALTQRRAEEELRSEAHFVPICTKTKRKPACRGPEKYAQ